MRQVFILLLIILPFAGVAQQDTIPTKKVKFNPDFRFTDGIFMNIEDVKRNNPIPKARIITDLNYDDYAFFDKLLEADVISVLDNMGQKTDIPVKDIWGLAKME
jgi:hypothetical protein